MGTTNQKQDHLIPDRGYKIISIQKPQILQKLNLLTDYIISPDPKLIDLSKVNDLIKFQIYSILYQNVRQIQIELINGKFGFQAKQTQINTCILRITKIFPGSPLQKYNIQQGQFIVGILQGNFTQIKSFAQLISNITTLAIKSYISLGICGHNGKTRIVKILISQLKDWKQKGKGLLGCQLAEGWIHRWKPTLQKKQNIQQIPIKSQQIVNTNNIPIPKILNIQNQQQCGSDQSDEVDKKCDELDAYYNTNGVMQIKYKGILKNQQLIDASTICKCKPINTTCQKCFIHKDDNYYFFNLKHNQIIAIPTKMMIPINNQ